MQSDSAQPYKPKAGTKIEAALAALASGPLRTPSLAEVMKCEVTSVHARLVIPIERKAIVRARHTGGQMYFALAGAPLDACFTVYVPKAEDRRKATAVPDPVAKEPAEAKPAKEAKQFKEAKAAAAAPGPRFQNPPNPDDPFGLVAARTRKYESGVLVSETTQGAPSTPWEPPANPHPEQSRITNAVMGKALPPVQFVKDTDLVDTARCSGLADGSLMFINGGDGPADYSALDCPTCGGSGHKGDMFALPGAELLRGASEIQLMVRIDGNWRIVDRREQRALLAYLQVLAGEAPCPAE